MALKKTSPAANERLNPFNGNDPAVEAALGSRSSENVYERVARIRNMTPAQRRKFERDAARTKLTVDLPSELIGQLNAVANIADDNFPVSQLVALLLKYGLAAVERGEIDLERHKVSSRVPRFRWFLVDDEGEEDGE